MTIERKTFISNGPSKKDIFTDLQEDQQSIIGTEVVPLNVYLTNLVDNTTTTEDEFARICNDILTHQFSNDFPYKEMLKYPSFIVDFYNLTLDMIRGNIPLENIQENESTKHKKEIISYIYNQPLLIKKIMDRFNKIEKVENTYIVSGCSENYFDHQIIQQLIQKGAKPYQVQKVETKKPLIYKAVNATQEVIGLAQHIVLNKDKYNLNEIQVMYTDTSYLPILTRIFDEYHIPYSSHKAILPMMNQKFVAYLKFLQTGKFQEFINAFCLDCFGNYDRKLNEYCAFLSIDQYEQLLGNLDTIHNWDNSKCCDNSYRYEYLKDLEKTTQQIMNEIKALSLPFDKPLEEKVKFVFEQLRKNANLDNDKDYLSLKEISKLCLRTVPIISENYEILNYLVETKLLTDIRYSKNGIEISDCYTKTYHKKHVFVLGCCNDVFPKNLSKNGIIDEAFLQNISSYPSIKERTALLKKQLQEIFDTIENVYFSYPTNTLDGSENVISRFLNAYHKKDEKLNQWKVENNDTHFINKGEIKSDTAAKLYLNDGELMGSVTGFQQYAKCPFSYFIERGLKIKDESFDINNATMGTIRHAIMENLFKNNQTDFDTTAKPYFDNLKELFIYRQENIEAMYQRLGNTMREKIAHAIEAQSQTSLKPVGFEETYEYEIPFGNNKIILKGAIDRVDKNDQFFVVVDYKSSKEATDFNLEEVLNGTHIQLATYLKAYSKNTGLAPLCGSYYVLTRKAIAKKENKTEEELIYAENRYITYLVSQQAKDILVKEFHAFKKATLEEDLLDLLDCIYIELTKRMLDGIIAIDPHDNACSFCKFKCICHNMKDASSTAPTLISYERKEQEND